MGSDQSAGSRAVEHGLDALVQLGDVGDQLGEVGAEHREHDARFGDRDGRGAATGAEDRALTEEVAGSQVATISPCLATSAEPDSITKKK